MKPRKAAFLLISFLLFILNSGWAAAQPRVNLYLIKFDNIRHEESLEWLRSAFPDMLRDYFKSEEGVQVKDQDDLEEIMNNRNLLLHQPRGMKNFLVLGKFERNLDDIKLNIQVINIANWEEVDSRKLSGKYSGIPDLNKQLTDALGSMVQPYIPQKRKKAYPDFSDPKPYKPKREFSDQSKAMTSSIDIAIDLLEESMDLVSGKRGAPPEKFEDAEGEWTLDLNVDNEARDNPENDDNTQLLHDVIDNLTNRPYHVSLSKPTFEYDKNDKSKMDVTFPVTYSLKENIIKDMLVSLPYSGLKQDGSLTIFYFNKDKFNFPSDFIEKIQGGEYRAVPVIQFTDANGIPQVVIVDSPDGYWTKQQSSSVLFIPVHRFSPLIDFTLGGWSLQVAMETVDIHVDYTFSMDINSIQSLEKVRLKFIPEDELESYLKQIL